MSRRRRLLFVTDACPLPLDRGQRVRVHNLLKACARAFDLTLVAPAMDSKDDRLEIESWCSHAVFFAPSPMPWLESLALTAQTARVVSGIARPSKIRVARPLVAALRDIQIGSFDLVWAERLQIARLCVKVRHRTIVDFDDVEHLKIAQELKLTCTPGEYARKLYSYAVYRHRELSWAGQFLAVAVSSDEDRAYLEDRGSSNVFTVPNGTIPPAQPTRGSAGRREPFSPLRVVFLGNVGYSANADAISFFAEGVLPALRAQVPDATFDVIGPGATQALTDRHGSLVGFRGYLEDLAPALAEYDVLVAPIRFGGGTKLKVLDAMAHRIPVVSTQMGVAGLSVQHGTHAWIADTIPEFVDGIIRVKRNPAFAERLADNAYALVSERFSWPAITDRLVNQLSALAAPAIGPSPRIKAAHAAPLL